MQKKHVTDGQGPGKWSFMELNLESDDVVPYQEGADHAGLNCPFLKLSPHRYLVSRASSFPGSIIII